jgi:hypothetical protein
MLELHLDFQPVLNVALQFIHWLMPLPDEWDIAGYILVALVIARRQLLAILMLIFRNNNA